MDRLERARQEHNSPSEINAAITERNPHLAKVTPEIMQVILLDELTGRVAEYVEKVSFKGKLDVRILAATDVTQSFSPLGEWPQVPWISIFLVNDGPDTAYIAINQASGWIRLLLNETRALDYSNSDEKIETIYYRCDPGQNASVRVEGQY